MKNHFYMSYAGNKREEVKFIYNHLNLDNITTIVEPFCGSCAISYYISTQKEGLKYILNDNNKNLLEMFNIIKNEDKCLEFEILFNKLVSDIGDDKNKYLEIINKNNLIGWFIKHKIYCIRPGLYPNGNRTYKKTIKLSDFPIYNFFKNNNIEFYNLDATIIYNKYKVDDKALILMDPPYLQLCNDFYLDSSVNIYEYLNKNPIKKEKARIILILEDMWIVKLLFKDNIILESYNKLYQTSKKKTTHIIITNE
jgi:site-specific DNA-adenine methylase